MHLIFPYHFLRSGCNLRLWEEPYSFSSLTPPSLCSSCLGMFSLPRCASNNWLVFQKACKENLEWEPDSLCPSVKLAFHLLWAVCHSTIITVTTVPLVWIFISSSDLYHPLKARYHNLDASLESKQSSHYLGLLLPPPFLWNGIRCRGKELHLQLLRFPLQLSIT